MSNPPINASSFAHRARRIGPILTGLCLAFLQVTPVSAQQPAPAPAPAAAPTLAAPAVALPAPAPAAAEKPKLALHAAKIITCAGEPIINGTILVSNGKIEAIGPRSKIKVPAGYTEIDQGEQFAMPGLVEVHCHIAGSGDLNEMVYQTNPELRVLDNIVPNNDALKLAVAGGVTTVCYIPGSGTNMGGFGAILKTGPGTVKDVLVRFPGVLKIAQAGNPERGDGTLGSYRMGMNYVIREQLRQGREYVKAWDDFESGKTKIKPALNLRLENFKPLFHKEIPVLVHTQIYQVVMSSIRILHDEMNLNIVIGHGEFDAFKLGKLAAQRNIPLMVGPRGYWLDPENGQVKGLGAEWYKENVRFLGVNTDSPVVPEEELFFQATWAVRQGVPEDLALHGITINAAKALMIDKRVGSLEVGKDADILFTTGSILDPRNHVTKVLIDGKVVYDTAKERRLF